MNSSPSADAPTHVANADYTVVDRSPLTLAAGETVTLGNEDKAWEGWVWAVTAEGRGTYLPVSFLEKTGEERARLREPFAAVDLSVKKGDPIVSLRGVSGWFWCRDAKGSEGWLPDYVMAPA
ncbi:MAG: Variant protein [Verrucomicrobiales bacterium]|nr:Variant protein [Verrucomicrobiales bacterium]